MIHDEAAWAIIAAEMASRLSPYPVDGHGFVRQCAWCLLVADDQGIFALTAPSLLQGATVTHGCCQRCRARIEDEVLAKARAGLTPVSP